MNSFPSIWYSASRQRIERWLASFASSEAYGPLLLGAVVILLTFPMLFLTGYHYEEGLTAALAKDALQGGRWYVPELFGFR